jgi:hypothetical protein
MIRQKQLRDFMLPLRSAWHERSSAFFMNFMIQVDVTVWLSRIVRKDLPIYAA